MNCMIYGCLEGGGCFGKPGWYDSILNLEPTQPIHSRAYTAYIAYTRNEVLVFNNKLVLYHLVR